MAIKISQGFQRTSGDPIDETLTLTKAQMKAVEDEGMPEKYFTVCQDDGKIYLYDKNNTVDENTGKFRKLEGGSGGSYTAGEGIKIENDEISIDDPTAKQVELTQAEYDALTETEKTNGTIYFITDGIAPTKDMSIIKKVLYENMSSANPQNVTLSDSIFNYDQIMILGYVPSSGVNHLMSDLLLSDDIQISNSIGLSDQASRYMWYNVISSDELALRIAAGGILLYKIIGISYGSKLDGTIGRWEKIGEWTGPQTGLYLDLSPYNAISFSPIYNNDSPRNSVVVEVADFKVGAALISENGDTWQGEFQRKTEDTFDIRLTGASKSVLYGYKETGVSDTDAQRIADRIEKYPKNGAKDQVLTKASDNNQDVTWKFVDTPSLQDVYDVNNEIVLALGKDVIMKNSTGNVTNSYGSFGFNTVTKNINDLSQTVSEANVQGKSLSLYNLSTRNQREAYFRMNLNWGNDYDSVDMSAGMIAAFLKSFGISKSTYLPFHPMEWPLNTEIQFKDSSGTTGAVRYRGIRLQGSVNVTATQQDFDIGSWELLRGIFSIGGNIGFSVNNNSYTFPIPNCYDEDLVFSFFIYRQAGSNVPLLKLRAKYKEPVTISYNVWFLFT